MSSPIKFLIKGISLINSKILGQAPKHELLYEFMGIRLQYYGLAPFSNFTKLQKWYAFVTPVPEGEALPKYLWKPFPANK